MDWSALGLGFALLLILEGILPFLSPRLLKQSYASITQLNDRVIRVVGLSSMLVGLLLLMWLRR